MANFQPLVYQELPQRLKTVLPENAPVGMRMAAAEGNLPLITQDLVTCLYYLSSDDDPRVRRSARKHLRELPETILRRALLAEISPKILDWFASVDLSPQELYELIILNKGTPDSAYIEMAKRVKDTRVLQLLARNEQRFLRNPRILAALRANPHLSAEVREWSKDFFRRHTGKDLEDVLSPDEILEIIRDVPDAVIGEVDMAPPPEAVAPEAVAPEAATPEAVAPEAEGAPEAVEDRQVAPAHAAPTIEVIQIPDPNAEFFANIQPLRWEQLSPRLQTVVPEDAAKSIRMAVAKSNLPLETVDLVMGMFYVAFDADPEVRVAARASLTELPASLLNTTLSTPMPAAILELFSRIELPDPALYEKLLLNRNTPNSAFVRLASTRREERVIRIIAGNEQRLLAEPRIIAALERNAATPISILDRARSFYKLSKGRSHKEAIEEIEAREAAEQEAQAAAREAQEAAEARAEALEAEELSEEAGEEIEAIEQPAETGGELIGDELPEGFSVDDLLREQFDPEEKFAKELLEDPDEALDKDSRQGLNQQVNAMTVLEKMQLALSGNIEARTLLMKNPNRLIQECVLRNPKITIDEIIRVATDKSQKEEIIRMVAANRDWTKSYAVVHALCWNPKTPFLQASKYLGRLYVKDLQKIAKSKAIPGMLAVQARRLVAEKQRFN